MIRYYKMKEWLGKKISLQCREVMNFTWLCVG